MDTLISWRGRFPVEISNSSGGGGARGGGRAATTGVMLKLSPATIVSCKIQEALFRPNQQRNNIEHSDT